MLQPQKSKYFAQIVSEGPADSEVEIGYKVIKKKSVTLIYIWAH